MVTLVVQCRIKRSTTCNILAAFCLACHMFCIQYSTPIFGKRVMQLCQTGLVITVSEMALLCMDEVKYTKFNQSSNIITSTLLCRKYYHALFHTLLLELRQASKS